MGKHISHNNFLKQSNHNKYNMNEKYGNVNTWAAFQECLFNVTSKMFKCFKFKMVQRMGSFEF